MSILHVCAFLVNLAPIMPRVARRSVGGIVYHVLNRGNSRRRLFAGDVDYLAFAVALLEALRRWPGVKLLAFCIMPNHWHLVLQPSRDGELSHFMRWLTQTHTQRWRHFKHTVGYGALYQGRYKSFIVKEDRHLLILCRYVERNALRAKLVTRAESWRWCSAWMRLHPAEPLAAALAPWPVERPRNWLVLLNQQQRDSDEQRVRQSIARNRPLGDDEWVTRTARKMNLSHTLRPPGRPKGAKDRTPRAKRKRPY